MDVPVPILEVFGVYRSEDGGGCQRMVTIVAIFTGLRVPLGFRERWYVVRSREAGLVAAIDQSASCALAVGTAGSCVCVCAGCWRG